MSAPDAFALSEANRNTLNDLRRSLELAEGFALFFARVNLPALRDRLISQLAAEMSPLGHVVPRVDLHPDESVLRLLLESTAAPEKGSLHICGLEHQMKHGVKHPRCSTISTWPVSISSPWDVRWSFGSGMTP